jgi:hypothetical protein
MTVASSLLLAPELLVPERFVAGGMSGSKGLFAAWGEGLADGFCGAVGLGLGSVLSVFRFSSTNSFAARFGEGATITPGTGDDWAGAALGAALGESAAGF